MSSHHYVITTGVCVGGGGGGWDWPHKTQGVNDMVTMTHNTVAPLLHHIMQHDRVVPRYISVSGVCAYI